MNQNSLTKIIVVFAVLTAAGVSLIAASQGIALADVRSVLLMIGTGLFTAALTFFLVEMFRRQAH